jgi:hypothetical protein
MQMFPPDPDHADDTSSANNTNLPSSPGRQVRRVASIALRIWNPRPIPRPQIDSELAALCWPERCAEVVCFTLLSIEHWLSQGGLLREWIRLNLWLAVILTVVAVLVIPPVTAVLEAASEWTAIASAIVGNITEAILKLPPIVLALATLFLVVKALQRLWQRRRVEQQGYRQHEDLDRFQ